MQAVSVESHGTVPLYCNSDSCAFYLLYLNLVYILYILHHVSYYLITFSVVCMQDCGYEDTAEQKSSV